MLHRGICTVLLGLVLSFSPYAQGPYAVRIDRDTGLPSDIIYDIKEDDRGFIWMATGEGLVRFDGHHMALCKVDGVSGRAGSNLKIDEHGRVWYQSFDGDVYYNEGLKLHKLNQEKPIGFFDFVVRSHHVYVLLRESVAIYDAAGGRLIRNVPFDAKHVFFTYADGEGYHIFSLKHYLIKPDGSIEVQKLPENFKSRTPIVGTVRENELWYINKENNEKCIYRIRNGVSQKGFNTPELKFIQNVFFMDGKFWFCCSDGLYIYDESGRLQSGSPLFPNISISSVFRDSEGGYWIGSITEGAMLVKTFDRIFFPTPGFKPNRLAAFHDELMVGMKTGQMFTMERNTPPKEFFKSKGNHGVYLLESDDDGNRLYCTSSSFTVFNRRKEVVALHFGSFKDVEAVDEKYTAFAGSGASGLLITGNANLKSPWDSLFEKYQSAYAMNDCSFAEGRGKSVCYHPGKNTLFYVTNQGLFQVTPLGIRPILEEERDQDYVRLEMMGDTILALHPTGKIRLIDVSGTPKRVDTPESLDGSWRMMRKDHDLIFLLSDKEAAYLDIKDRELKIHRIIGLSSEDRINDITQSGNTFYIASDEGVLKIPHNRCEEVLEPRLFIDEIKIGGESYRRLDLSFLRYNQNNVSIEFSIVSYPGNPDEDVFYSMDNKTWTRLNHDVRLLELPALKPGFYSVYLRAGLHGRVVKSPDFIIRKPFWESYGFIFSMVLIIGVGGYLYYRYQTRLLKRQNRLLLDKISLEKDLQVAMMRSIKSQMNPHFFYNALNTIQSFIFNDDKRNAGIYLSKFSHLTRRILEMSERETVTVAEEIQTIQLYLEIESVRFNNEFEFSIHMEDHLDPEITRLPGMLIQPYVENAIKHGLLHKKGKKTLVISLFKTNAFLKIALEDNGIGRERSKELNAIKNRGHQSFATHANSKRLELLNKTHGTVGVEFFDLKDDSGHPVGTRVFITVPINT